MYLRVTPTTTVDLGEIISFRLFTSFFSHKTKSDDRFFCNFCVSVKNQVHEMSFELMHTAMLRNRARTPIMMRDGHRARFAAAGRVRLESECFRESEPLSPRASRPSASSA